MQSKYPPDKRNRTLLRGDPQDWPAAVKLAIKIRIEVEEKASVHRALWERLDRLILAALENRIEDPNQDMEERRAG
jgi:hypothetical protein